MKKYVARETSFNKLKEAGYNSVQVHMVSIYRLLFFLYINE